MAASDRLVHLVDRIYEAAAEPAFWSPVLGEITSAIGGQSATLLLTDEPGVLPVIAVAHNVDDASFPVRTANPSSCSSCPCARTTRASATARWRCS